MMTWYFLLFLLGSFCLPITFSLLGKFWDRGYAFSKIIAILLVSYLVWLLGSLKLVAFGQKSVWGIVICLGIANWRFFKRQSASWRTKFKIFLIEELLFFFCLISWSWIRGFQPDIHGLEKYMDYGFVNAILRSRFFPPQDIWMSGKTINYYYFGHLVTAVLTKLSGLDSAVTYNLMIATIFSLCFTATFSLGTNLISLEIRNLKLVILGGLLSAALLTLGGNLHPLWYFLTHKNFSGYWYPDATRFIVEKFGALDNTIHEFPLYSFVVADLHGHLLNLPFVLLFLALLLHQSSFLLPLTLAVMYMTNAWDLPIYLLVLGATTLWFQKNLWQTVKFVICHLSFVILFSLPFHFHFQSIAQGIGLVDFHSPIWMLLVLWGFPLLMTIGFLATKARQKVDHFVWILLAVSWFLILVPEIFYIKDIYIHSFQRANTMFKLTYQAFVMFSLVSGYIIVRLFKKPFVICHLSLVIFLLFYPYFAIRSYYGLKTYQGLNGLKYLDNLYPDDYQAILWLKENIKGQAIILEAVGDSYTDFARVSANTGLATVVGWPVHEWLWRGSYDEVGQRREEVRKIYEEGNQELLRKYNVKYVFLGSLEKKQYKIDEEKLAQLGKIVYQKGQTKVYKI